MTKQNVAMDPPERQGVPDEPARKGGALKRREEDAPLIVEVAWLVIEAATVVARLRRILTRL
jgi:hypothetical protein